MAGNVATSLFVFLQVLRGGQELSQKCSNMFEVSDNDTARAAMLGTAAENENRELLSSGEKWAEKVMSDEL